MTSTKSLYKRQQRWFKNAKESSQNRLFQRTQTYFDAKECRFTYINAVFKDKKSFMTLMKQTLNVVRLYYENGLKCVPMRRFVIQYQDYVLREMTREQMPIAVYVYFVLYTGFMKSGIPQKHMNILAVSRRIIELNKGLLPNISLAHDYLSDYDSFEELMPKFPLHLFFDMRDDFPYVLSGLFSLSFSFDPDPEFYCNNIHRAINIIEDKMITQSTVYELGSIADTLIKARNVPKHCLCALADNLKHFKWLCKIYKKDYKKIRTLVEEKYHDHPGRGDQYCKVKKQPLIKNKE